MANNPEAIGQLLANSALMKDERELLRKQEEPRDATKTSSHPKAEPIVNNNKTVETVLLTLLDEQLHAAEAEVASQPKSTNATDGDINAQKRVAAKYTADGLTPGDDPLPPGPVILNDQVRMRETPSVVSADLQTFVQRFAAVAAGQPTAAASETRATARRSIGIAAALFNRASPLRLASAIAVLLWLVALIVRWAVG
ncbi:MAG TPA: hypothetical protein VHC71_10165 [Hyphomicrobium sp.]|nr:hypothetical protein [Hyphomicrobium sp.]